jgi:uncharacterized protein YukE
MAQYSHRPLYSIAEEVTPQDHQILRHGGTSSTIERLPSRLQRSKRSSIELRQQIEDLTYEVSYLKGELSWHQESKKALFQLQEEMYQLFHKMEDALVQVSTKLRESEEHYLSLWGLDAEQAKYEGMI